MRATSIFNILFFSSLFVFYSCDSPSNSGPCEYTEEKFKMHIVGIEPDPSAENMFIVWVDFDGNMEWAKEQKKLSDVRDVVTDSAFLENNYIQPGNIYSGTFHKLVPESGNCDDFIVDWDQKLR